MHPDPLEGSAIRLLSAIDLLSHWTRSSGHELAPPCNDDRKRVACATVVRGQYELWGFGSTFHVD